MSEAYKRITDPDSFKDDDDSMDEDEVNTMFRSMFAEIIPMMMGGRDAEVFLDGNLPVSFLEAILSQGFYCNDEYEDEYDEEDEDFEDGEIMDQFLSMLNEGPVYFDGDDDEIGMTENEFHHIVLQQMLRGGSSIDVDMSDFMFPPESSSTGSRSRRTHARAPLRPSLGSSKPTREPLRSSKKKQQSNVNVGEWHTDSSGDDRSEAAKEAAKKAKKSAANAKKNKRKGSCMIAYVPTF